MGLARWLGDNWWLPGAGVFVAIAALFTFVSPYIDYTTDPLRDEDARRGRRSLRTASSDCPTSRSMSQEVSGGHRRGQRRCLRLRADAAGRLLGHDSPGSVRSRRAEGRSRPRAGTTTRSGDLPEGIAWFAIFAIPGALILMLATRGRGGMGAPEAIPVALLVAAVFQLATAPAANWVTRRMEAEADWKALEVTRDPEALEGVMLGLWRLPSATPTRRLGTPPQGNAPGARGSHRDGPRLVGARAARSRSRLGSGFSLTRSSTSIVRTSKRGKAEA